ncbi:MAG: cell division protein SepF [Fimbriimonadaceae bacterium]
MEELELQDKPGIFSRITGIFSRNDEDAEEEGMTPSGQRTYQMRSAYKYHVTVRRQIVSFDDALAAAQGLKTGEQQIINLSGTDPAMRQKIVDFMCGVNFAQEGTWEEIGDNIFLIVPSSVYVEVAPATPRGTAIRN